MVRGAPPRHPRTNPLSRIPAERSLYSAEEALIESQALIATDYVALNKVLGGGWEARSIPSDPPWSTPTAVRT